MQNQIPKALLISSGKLIIRGVGLTLETVGLRKYPLAELFSAKTKTRTKF